MMRRKRYAEPEIQWQDDREQYDESQAMSEAAYDPYMPEDDAPAYSQYADEADAFDSSDEALYGDEYEDYDDAQYGQGDSQGRIKVAMSVFNVVSTLAGVLLILVLVGLLLSLFNWLSMDIRHSFVLLQSNLQ